MKNSLLFLLTIVFSPTFHGQQETVKGNLSTTDTADLKILNIYPDSFPNISVVFKAETRKGEPVWNLTKEKMVVKENFQSCNIISLEQISKNKPINLGVVIDHSGSMQEDLSQFFDKDGKPLFSYDANLQPVLPKGYIPPIDHAKSAVKTFVSTFNFKKDFISIIGFSRVVDRPLPLTQDITKINALVDSMKADFSTALYDAMIVGIDEIKKANGVRVLVVLTDGHDNSSKSNWENVIDKANKENIPVYIIGLGQVNVNTLTQITKSTKGRFYYTKSSKSLDTVYAEISKQVQAFYELIYTSPNFSSADSTRQIELSFDIDNTYLVTQPESSDFPAEVIEVIAQKEKEKQYYIYGGIALAVLITTGTLLLYYKRKKQNKIQPIIKNLFPNPTNGNIELDYVSNAGNIQITDLNGRVIKKIDISGVETKFDLSDLRDGNYIAVIQSGGLESNAIKFIVQR